MNTALQVHPWSAFLDRVEKPGRYTGGEYQAVVRDWDTVACTLCLAFPDVYDVGMSHLGTKILYSLLNRCDDLLVERCFAPWFDMEAELRARGLPLISLESWRPLRDFDVVGFSLQYEMTYTSVLTMLDLGGIPLRNADRTLDDPLVIAGGPSATHPEPIAPFIDAFVIGDAEERLPRLLRHWAQMKAEGGRTRLEMLAELAREGGVYCPDLYTTRPCPRTGLHFVSAPVLPGVPARVERAFLDDISRYRFPDDSPVAVAEAVFDRMGIEIARGCTEGCRFCQAGMIYRPVRERDPDEVVETLVSAIEKGGYDEVAITSLSTADYSCIAPLITKIMERLRERKVALGISSLRAYGLSDELLDEIASVKATGLTFAPEAGTQRMRDVINKNISEEDIFTTCHRVFSKGWQKMKLYFILGLPTETDDDVVGIGRMGRQAAEIGREYNRRGVKVTVSVSSHVPKPHTPFQWAAMDDLESLARKQATLRDLARPWGYHFRGHDMRVNWLECIVGRGDRRIGEVIEGAWRRGARFDGWDERLAFDAWTDAIAEWEQTHNTDSAVFFGTLPVDARLPWDHIDVGLEDGFLLREYRKALANRLSPPCGKPRGMQVHHTNLEDAHADERALVCYHCGIACDLDTMREERFDFLEKLGARAPVTERGPSHREQALARLARGEAPNDFGQGVPTRYRVRFAKLGAAVYQGHLDLVRQLPRLLRRGGLPVLYTQGFSPRPVMTFGPALGLGQRSLCEYFELELDGDFEPADVLARLNASAPGGLIFTGVRRLRAGARDLAAALDEVDVVIAPDAEALAALAAEAGHDDALGFLALRAAEAFADPDRAVIVERKGRKAPRRLRDAIVALSAGPAPSAATGVAGAPALLAAIRPGEGATLRPAEIVEAVLGQRLPLAGVLRAEARCFARGGAVDPLLADGPDAADVALLPPSIATTVGAAHEHDGAATAAAP